MRSLKKINKSFKKLLSTRKDVEIPAFLGNLAGTVKADNDSNVYVVLFNGEVVTVRNVRVPNVSRLPVVIGYDSNNPTLLQVIRARNTFVNPIYPDVPEHSAATHQWPNPDVLWVRGEQIMPGLAIPSGLTVEFVGFVYYLSGWYLLENQTIDLSGEVPASGANYVLVEVDNAGAITFNAGASVASREVLTHDDIPTPTANKMPLFAVKMYVGQTEILKSLLQSDIVDLRWSNWSAGGIADAPSDSVYYGRRNGVWTNLKTYFDTLYALLLVSTASNDFQVGNGSGGWIKKTLAETITILRTSLDSIFAPIAKGVTNGDSHDHNGGDGAQIAHGNLSSIGTNTHGQIDTHIANTSNPHSTTAAQAGAIPNDGWVTDANTWTFKNRTQAYTNDPAAGSSITLNMVSTTDFVVGSDVTVSSSAGSENTYVTAVVANTSIIVNRLLLNHTTTSPLVTLLDVFTINADVTATIKKGAKLQFTQTTVKYGTVYSSINSGGTTTIVMIHNTDYALVNAAISSTYYSYIELPNAWPEWFNFNGEPIGFSTYPPTVITKFRCIGKTMLINSSYSGAAVSNATTFTSSAPTICAATISTINLFTRDNSVSSLAVARSYIIGATRTIDHKTDMNAGAWTAANNKLVNIFFIMEY